MKPSSGLAASVSALLAIVLIGYLCRSQAVIHASGQNKPEVITSGRPLNDAAWLLEGRYLRPITYEETIWLWPGDKGPWPNMIGLVPKERSFILPSGLSPDRTPVLDETVLRKVLDAYHSQTDGPRFRVLTSNYGLHIVPVKARDASGTWVDVRSPLDSFIDLPVTSRTPMEHFIAFCRAVTEACGVVVKPMAHWLDQIFFPPGTAFFPKDRDMTEEEKRAISITWGGRMRARDALINLVQLSDTTLTWKLRCSAEPDQFYDGNYGCGLNLGSIMIKNIRADGSVGWIFIYHDRSKKKPPVPE
jgi:hypothetical protein